MMKREQFDLTQSVRNLLRDWNLTPHVTPDEIVQHVLDGSAYWTTDLPDGTTLALVRLYSPVVERREVFLGNVLLNDFLFKALPRAVARANLGEAAPLLNDLENAYVLWRGDGDLEALRKAYREEMLRALPDLYFGEENIEQGIHGDLSKMFTFTKSDFEPYPVYSVPAFLAQELEHMIRERVRWLLDREDYESNFRTVMASLAFFYGQTSGGTGDAQSFANFLYRLVDHYKVLSAEKVKSVLGLDEVSKPNIKNAIDNDQFEPSKLRDFLFELGHWFAEQIDLGDQDWFLGFIRSDEKLIPLSRSDFLDEVVGLGQIGFLSMRESYSQSTKQPVCPVCGDRLPTVRESYITVGKNKSRFTTRSSKRKSYRDTPVICARCALSVYVAARAVGTDDVVWQKSTGRTARMPRLYNIIFHYGDHADWELEAIQRQIDYVLAEVGGEKETDDLWDDLQRLRDEVAHQHGAAVVPIDLMDWMASMSSALEVIHQMQQDVEAEVIPLGGGAYRLLVFILPQLRPGSREGLEFVQKRFSHSRLAVTTLLGFLRQLCGCDGPYYFQSVPRLTPGGFDANTFYIRGEAEQADEALRRYGLITEFARRVVPYRTGHSQLADWILLAEQVERDPLAVFSDVLRKSPIRGGDKFQDFRYKRLSNDFVPGMSMVDGTEYLALFEHLRDVQDELQS